MLKVSEAAEIFGVDSTTVLRWIEKRFLKSIHYPSGSHRIPEDEVNKFLAKVKSKKERYRVMIIDDEQDVLDTLKEMLDESELPLEIKTNTDGLKALLEIGSFKPDIIIIDYKLEDVDGITISNKILRSEEFSKIPVIMISGIIHSLPTGEVGIARFIRKPFRSNELNTALKECLAAN